jgi:hypothetical protein
MARASGHSSRHLQGDPRAYEVRGTLIALRRDQAAHILVRPVADPPPVSPDHEP